MPYIFVDKDGNNTVAYSSHRVFDSQVHMNENSQEWIGFISDIEQANETEHARQSEYMQEQENSGLKNITLDQAKTWIDNKLDNAGTTGEKIEAIRDIFHKIAVFLV